MVGEDPVVEILGCGRECLGLYCCKCITFPVSLRADFSYLPNSFWIALASFASSGKFYANSTLSIVQQNIHQAVSIPLAHMLTPMHSSFRDPFAQFLFEI